MRSRSPGCERPALVVDQHPGRFFARERLDRDEIVSGSEEDFDELLGQRLAERGADRLVDHDHTPVRRSGIGRERLRVRLFDRVRNRNPTRIGVLDDDAGGPLEPSGEKPCSREIIEVVVRQRLALQLIDAGKEVHPRAPFRVIRATLVRVLTVRDRVVEVEDGEQRLGERLVAREPARDGSVVRAGACEGACGKRPPGFEVDIARPAKLLEHHCEVLWAAEWDDEGVILCSSAEHRRAADIDLLDRVRPFDIEPADGALERIEVDVHEIDGADPVLLELGLILGNIAPREDSAVDGGMEGDDPMAKHVRKPCELGDRSDRDAVAGDEIRGATTRDKLNPEPV